MEMADSDRFPGDRVVWIGRGIGMDAVCHWSKEYASFIMTNQWTTCKSRTLFGTIKYAIQTNTYANLSVSSEKRPKSSRTSGIEIVQVIPKSSFWNRVIIMNNFQELGQFGLFLLRWKAALSNVPFGVQDLSYQVVCS